MRSDQYESQIKSNHSRDQLTNDKGDEKYYSYKEISQT